MTDHRPSDTRQIGDSFAVAILQWPAIILAVELDGGGWALAARIVLGAWALIVALGITFGRREGPRWGLVMTLAAASAAALWLSYPSFWCLAWFLVLMIAFHTGIRTRLDEADGAAAGEVDLSEGHAPEPAGAAH